MDGPVLVLAMRLNPRVRNDAHSGEQTLRGDASDRTNRTTTAVVPASEWRPAQQYGERPCRGSSKVHHGVTDELAYHTSLS